MQFDPEMEKRLKLAGDHLGRRLAMLMKAVVVDGKDFVPDEVGAIGNGVTDIYRAVCGLEPRTDPIDS